MAEVEAGFAKLQGEDFEYYMQTYSIVLGRNSKKSSVDVDLTTLGGAMNISRHHARIFYDFHRRRFALEVIGKNGCLVEGVLHLPGNPPVKLDSQDLLQIGDKKFYFLLPVRSILQPSFDRSRPPSLHLSPPVAPPPGASNSDGPSLVASAAKKGHGRLKLTTSSSPADYEHGPANKRARKGEGLEKSLGFASTSGSGGNGSKATPTIKRKKEAKVRIDKGGNSHHLLQQEEKDVVSCVATVLSDLCGPGEWMSMEKLHSELIEQYNGIWPPSRVRRYLTSDDCLISEAKGRPWFGLLTLLRKCPEHFVINTKSRGKTSSEFVSLVSLLS